MGKAAAHTTLDDITEWGQTIDPPAQMASRAEALGLDLIDMLVNAGITSRDVYESPPGPKSEIASARRLIQLYETLESLALLAPRDRDGALLKPPPRANAPWQPSRPKSVQDIPPYSAENLARWRDTVAQADSRAVAARVAPASRKPRPAKPSSRPPQLQVARRGKTKPSPLAPLLLYFGDRGKIIEIVKTSKDVTFRTEEGRLIILTQIIRAVCGDFRLYPDHTGTAGKDGEATAEQLARAMLRSDVIAPGGGIAALLFTAERNDIKLFDLMDKGESMRLLIEASAARVIQQFTDVRKDFIPDRKAPEKGCAAIKWMHELMADLPLEYKLLWVARKQETDRGIYAGNLQAGMWVPIGRFIPVDDNESKKRELLFLGSASGFADKVIVMTEEGRILEIDERQRDLQSFCTAVMSVAPFIAMSYMVAAVAGAILVSSMAPAVFGEILSIGTRVGSRLLGPRIAAWEASSAVKWVDTLIASSRWEAIVNAGISAASISFSVQQAGSLKAYIKSLKNPLEAGLLLLDLLSIRGAFSNIGKLIDENRLIANELAQIVREEKGLALEGKFLKGELESAKKTEQAVERGKLASSTDARATSPKGEVGSGKKTGQTVDRGELASSSRARAGEGRMVHNRLGAPEAAAKKDTPQIAWPEDMLAARRAAAKDAKAVAPPPRETIPAKGPIQSRPKPVEAARTDEPIKVQMPDEVDLMRRKRAAAQRGSQVAEERYAADEMAEEADEALDLAAGAEKMSAGKKGAGSGTKGKNIQSRDGGSRGGIVGVHGGGPGDAPESLFDRLLRRLTEHKRANKREPGNPKPVMTEECHPELIDHVRRARATDEAKRVDGEAFDLDSFDANYAAFQVTVDGKPMIIVARNTEGSMHSEHWIVAYLEKLVGPLKAPSNRARVKVHQVFTEREPCRGQCERIMSDLFKEAKVFFWVPQSQRWSAAKKILHEFWLGLTPTGAAP